MAITQAVCTSFKQELLVEGHNFTNGQDTFKIAFVINKYKNIINIQLLDYKKTLKE